MKKRLTDFHQRSISMPGKNVNLLNKEIIRTIVIIRGIIRTIVIIREIIMTIMNLREIIRTIMIIREIIRITEEL
jgi:hypothetical protein